MEVAPNERSVSVDPTGAVAIVAEISRVGARKLRREVLVAHLASRLSPIDAIRNDEGRRGHSDLHDDR
jgi:hypothetical protein